MDTFSTESQTSSYQNNGYIQNTGNLARKHRIVPLLVTKTLPNIDHIITEDDTPVDNLPSAKQQRLLVDSLYDAKMVQLKKRPFLADANVGLFFEPGKSPLVPDVFLSFDIQVAKDWWEKHNRSYFTWIFGKVPEVVIEIVSNKVGGEGSTKLQDYADIGIPHYVIFDPQKLLSEDILRIYQLSQGKYVKQSNTWLRHAGLGLTLWKGSFEEQENLWLRWRTRNGRLLLTGTERAEQERERAEQERERAEQERERAKLERQRAELERERAELERERAEHLAAKLRELGIDPDKI